MSGKRAAQALLELDTELASSAANILESDQRNLSGDRRDRVLQVVRERVLGTWTLTLAARAAGVSEEVVVSALLYQLRIGSTCVCQGEARRLFQ